MTQENPPICPPVLCLLGFPGGSDGKESTCNARDLGSIPGFGRSPGGGHGNPLLYSCQDNPMDREAQWAIVREDSPGKNTGVCCEALLQGIFQTQGMNPSLSH